jgi:hypothetical protein
MTDWLQGLVLASWAGVVAVEFGIADIAEKIIVFGVLVVGEGLFAFWTNKSVTAFLTI